MYGNGLGVVGVMTQYDFEWVGPAHPDRPNWGPGSSHATTATSEAEARAILERAVGLPPASRVIRTTATAPLPTVTIDGKQVLDPAGLIAYQQAMSAGVPILDAIDAGQKAAAETRGVLNVTSGTEGSKVDLTIRAPDPVMDATDTGYPTVKLAGVGGKLGLLLALGLGLALFRKR